MPISTNILWIFLMFLTANLVKMDVKKGPFKVVLESLNHCQSTTYPLAKDPPIIWDMAIIGPNKNNMRGNITIKKDTKHVQIRMKCFTWNGSKWKLTHVMQAGSCRGSMLDIFTRMISLPIIDRSKCVLLKGTYDLGNLDPNISSHYFSSTQDYGRTLWRSELIVGHSTYQCWEFLNSVEPI